MMRFTSGMLALVFSLPVLASSPAGSLDSTFGISGGVVRTHFAEGHAQAYTLAEDLIGGLVLAGLVGPHEDSRLCLSRYTKDGIHDTDLNDEIDEGLGTVCHPHLLDSVVNQPYILGPRWDSVVGPAGDLYVAGGFFVMQEDSEQTFVCRFLPDGSKHGCVALSTGLTDGNGKGLTVRSGAASVLVADQRLLVIANSLTAPVLFSLSLSDLVVESQLQLLPDSSGVERAAAWSADLTADGDLVVVGEAKSKSNLDYFVLRIDLEKKALDPTFDQDGFKVIVYDLVDEGADIAYAVDALDNGDILVAGKARRSSETASIGIAWLDATGKAKASFDDQPTLQSFASVDIDFVPWSIAQTPSGKIAVSGEAAYLPLNTRTSFAMRLMPSGALDTSFSVGYAFFDFSKSYETANDMVLQGERIVLGGFIFPDQSEDEFLLFRVSDGRVLNDGFEPTVAP